MQPIQGLTPEEARKQAEAYSAELFGAKEAVDSVRRAGVEGVPVRIYSPSKTRDLPLVVYLHGGGWVLGLLVGFGRGRLSLVNRTGGFLVAGASPLASAP